MFLNVGFVVELILTKSYQEVKQDVGQNNFKVHRSRKYHIVYLATGRHRFLTKSETFNKMVGRENDFNQMMWLMGSDTKKENINSEMVHIIRATFKDSKIEDIRSIKSIMSYKSSVDS